MEMETLKIIGAGVTSMLISCYVTYMICTRKTEEDFGNLVIHNFSKLRNKYKYTIKKYLEKLGAEYYIN